MHKHVCQLCTKFKSIARCTQSCFAGLPQSVAASFVDRIMPNIRSVQSRSTKPAQSYWSSQTSTCLHCYLYQNSLVDPSIIQATPALPTTLRQVLSSSSVQVATLNGHESSVLLQECSSAHKMRRSLHRPGFDRAFRNLRAAPCQGPDAEGACPLLSCKVVHFVPENS